LTGKLLEDSLCCQGPRIIVKQWTVKGKLRHKNSTLQYFGAHIYCLGEELNCADECMT